MKLRHNLTLEKGKLKLKKKNNKHVVVVFWKVWDLTFFIKCPPTRMCHVSHVTCHYKVVELVGGGSVINGATMYSFIAFNQEIHIT